MRQSTETQGGFRRSSVSAADWEKSLRTYQMPFIQYRQLIMRSQYL
jgi:hypothetical protein